MNISLSKDLYPTKLDENTSQCDGNYYGAGNS